VIGPTSEVQDVGFLETATPPEMEKRHRNASPRCAGIPRLAGLDLGDGGPTPLLGAQMHHLVESCGNVTNE
jgi:hypothetical protein